MHLMVIDGNSILTRAFYGIRMLTTKDGKITNQEIHAFGVESDVEKQKLADRNRLVSNMSMYYDIDKVDNSSLLDYRYLDDES